MSDMFRFLSMGPLADRKVARFEDKERRLVISTAFVNDGERPIETAVSDPEYNGGYWIIVEAYNDKDAAASGHERWVAAMNAETRPPRLVDCQNAEIAKMLDNVTFGRVPSK